MKPKYLILIFIILLNSLSFSQEQKENHYIHALINTICQNPDTLLTILKDSNYTSSEIRKNVEENYESLSSICSFLTEIDYLNKYFTNQPTLEYDTITKPYSNSFLKYDSIRFIALQGIEEKFCTFVFVQEANRWKILKLIKDLPIEIKFSLGDFQEKLKIIDSLVKNPELIRIYLSNKKESIYNVDKFNKKIKKYIEYINYNYPDGNYFIINERIYSKYYGDTSLEGKKFTFVNRNRQRPMSIIFINNDSQNKGLIYDFQFPSNKTDTLSEEEIRPNHNILNKILKYPDCLSDIIKDSNIADSSLIKFLSEDSTRFRMINYIKKYFQNDYSIEETAAPMVDYYGNSINNFYNLHKIILSNKLKNFKLYISFDDYDKLYHFKLSDLRSKESNIDGIDYENLQDVIP